MRYLLAAALCLILPTSGLAVPFFTLKGHGGPVMGIAVSPSGDQIATASFDYSAGIWRDGKPKWLDGHRAAIKAISFIDDNRLITAGDDFSIRVWDISAGTHTTLGTHQGKVNHVAIAPDRSRIASASWDGTIGLWSVDGTEKLSLKGHTAGVNAVAFSDDGASLYSSSADGTIRIWDMKTGEQKRLLKRHGFGVNTLLLNDKAGWLAYGAVDGVTRIIDPVTGKQKADFTLERRPILAMAVDRQMTRIAVGDGEGYIMVINVKRWEIIKDFRAALRGPVWALAFSDDGENIHSGGLDSALYSWPLNEKINKDGLNTEERSFQRAPETMSNGERQFQRKCSICHSLTPGSARRAGPTLHGVFGRAAGAVPDYPYSATLEKSDIIWSDKTIDGLFDLGPDHYIPGTKMPMQVIARPQDRKDLINFLREATKQ
ncbi:c-type cytochrome [Coralliovum pocilloporae]|uniref:c-type cytochrome n=1 Tax=Coralliovum pocilloporae TaxID=3066369 RepID=UPI0033074C95